MLYYLMYTVVLLCMSWEDFKTRSINLWLFVGLFVVILLSTKVDFTAICINLSILVAQVLVIIVYTYFKNKTINIFHFIGIGDLLFIALIALRFPPMVFQASLILALSLSLLYSWVARKSTQPLAGIYALVTLVALWTQYSEVAFFSIKNPLLTI